MTAAYRPPASAVARAARALRRAGCAFLAAAALVPFAPAAAQGYQARPIRIVVPNPPGGPTDIVGRIVGQKLAERIGVAVIIDNRAGASGTLGGDVVAKAAPDGHTLLLASSSLFVSTPILVPNAPFDSRRDLAPVTIIVSVPYVLLVNPASGIQSVKELVAQARARPGTLNYGTAGNGSTSHLASAMLGVLAGIDIVHVPYKGSAPAATDLIGGQLQFVIEAIAGGMQHVRSGRLRAIGISSRQRVASLPDVPTIAEAGVPGYEATVSHGICAPAKTSAGMIDQLNRDLVGAIRTPEARERLAGIGAEVVASSAEAYRDTIREEVVRWEKLVREIAARGR